MPEQSTGLKIGLTLLVKNEADVILQWLTHHLCGRVHEVVIMDNISSDGTWESLLELRPGVTLMMNDNQDYRQSEWVYNMDCILRDKGMDWAINLDADEFLHGDLLSSIQVADDNGHEQIYPISTTIRPTALDDASELDPIKRIIWHDPWTKPYPKSKAIVKLKHLTGVSMGNHWGQFDHQVEQAVMCPTLYMMHYDVRSPYQITKKYRGKFDAEKIKNMNSEWEAINKIWLAEGDAGLEKYYYSLIKPTHDGLEQGIPSKYPTDKSNENPPVQ